MFEKQAIINLPSAQGFTMRDWFASQAMVGLLARHRGVGGSGTADDAGFMEPCYVVGGDHCESLELAIDAYGVADAMLKARDG